MKIRKGDKVIVIAGRDRAKKGEVVAVLPKTGQLVVKGVNIVKRHTKPNAKNPKSGIVTSEKPLPVSRVMAVDPVTGKPARLGYKITEKGEKNRIFKVSKFVNKKIAKIPTQTPAVLTENKT